MEFPPKSADLPIKNGCFAKISLMKKNVTATTIASVLPENVNDLAIFKARHAQR